MKKLLFLFTIGILFPFIHLAPHALADSPPYTISQVAFRNSTDVNISTLEASSDIKVMASVQKNASTAPDGCMVITITDASHKLLSMNVVNMSLPDLATSTVLSNMTTPPNVSECTMKVFVWNGLENAQPISNIISVALNGTFDHSSYTAQGRQLMFVSKIIVPDQFSASTQLRALLPSGVWKTFELDTLVSINASLPPTAVDSLTDWKAIAGTRYNGDEITKTDQTYDIYTLALYDLTFEGKIRAIHFQPATNSDLGIFYKNTYDPAMYKMSTGLVNSADYINNETLLLDIPTDESTGKMTSDEALIRIYPSSILRDDLSLGDSQSSRTAIYRLSTSNEAAIVIGSGLGLYSFDFSEPLMIVDSTSHVLNSDGESVYKFNGYMSNKAVSIILSTNKVWTYDILDGAAGGENAKPYPTCLDASDIKKGCVILFYSNLKNEVELICKLFDCYSAINDAKDGIQNPYVNPYPSDRIVLFDKTIANKKYEFIFGYAYTRSSSTATLTKNNVTEPTGLSLYDYLIGPNTNVLCYDAFFGPSTKVSVGDASDIEFDKFGEGSFVFAKTCDGYLHDIINILPQW